MKNLSYQRRKKSYIEQERHFLKKNLLGRVNLFFYIFKEWHFGSHMNKLIHSYSTNRPTLLLVFFHSHTDWLKINVQSLYLNE